ncbi:MAG: chromosome segregation protein SMC [Candidatus Methanofastidiosa archaeon]|nr:chromosome segregation protein SMC [Candidatus Methanofastidiosa archaeon]
MILIVYIKKIMMKGFKSYGNRKISVPFHKGFTCVVGPNGSGKSNIFDAISFVLGRMSAKSMRAGSISDLVFAGTNMQKAAQYTEVSIYFDNIDKIFPFEKDEVIISRWVDKSGKSIYRVNNKRETRTFVVDLLNLVGLTSDGYNMIAQGDITRFVKMSSFDRRTIIEEISGIQEYDEKKEKGLRELGKAEENIARVDLVVNEVKSQLNRLENEKNDALRYQYLKDEISRNKGDMIFGELDDSNSELSSILSSIEEKNSKIQSMSSESTTLQADIIEKEALLNEMEEEFEDKSGHDYVDISREIASLTSKMDTIKMRIEMREGAKRANIGKRGELSDSIDGNISTMEEISSTLEGTRRDLTALEEELSSKEERYSKIVESLENTNNRFFDYKRDSDELEEKIGALKDSEYRLRGELTSFSERATAKRDNLEALERELNELDVGSIEAQMAVLKEDMDQRRGALKELDVASMRAKETELSNLIDAMDRKIQSLNRSITEMQSRIGRKSEQKEAYNRDIDATDEIIRLRDRGEIKGIIGKFSDLGKTRKEYAVALEVAAGQRMKNIVVEDGDVARACVNHLKRRQMGRLTFLPLEDLQPRFEPKRYSSNLSREGAIDFAINLVNFEEEHRKAFEFVFSNTLVISDIDVSKKMDRQRMVTLDGDIIETSGAITGGYWKPKKYLESFETHEDEEEIRALEKESEDYELKRSSIRSELDALRRDIDESSKIETKLDTEIRSLGIRIEEMGASYGRATKKRDALSSQIDAVKAAIKGLTESTGERQAAIDAMASEMAALMQRKEEIDRKVEEYRSEGVEESQALGEEISAMRKSREDLFSSIVSMDSRLGSLDERNKAMEGEISKLNEEIASIDADVEKLNEDIGEVEAELSSKREREAELANSLRNIKLARDNLRANVFEMRGRRELLREDLSKFESDVKVMEVTKDSLKERIEQLEEESKGYERSLEPVEDIKELRFRISRMEKEKEGLEPINMRAIEEFDEVEDRYIMLSSKREKLIQEKNSILSFIDEIETKKRDVFMQAFNVVKENFSEIFDILSPNGEGNLVLEDDEDPFSGGLFIEARPAGKELNRTESMSGGEKALTALAFVFAIQKFKPAPFYILDEIDAHLDDDNVRRVSVLIKKSSDSSQFIVITHRDVMMTAADRLFGTSVSKDKISKIVSVELEKVSDIGESDRYGIAQS